MFYLDDGYFILKFETIEERNQITTSGPYSFYGKPIIVKPFTAELNFYEEVLKVIPLWIKFPNLPLLCWGSDSLSRISSLLGVPMFSDEYTTNQDRVSFARVLVEVDITSSLPDHVWIEDSYRKVFKQFVLYDWKPAYCKAYCTAGHDRTKVSKPPISKPVVKKKWVPKVVQSGSCHTGASGFSYMSPLMFIRLL